MWGAGERVLRLGIAIAMNAHGVKRFGQALKTWEILGLASVARRVLNGVII